MKKTYLWNNGVTKSMCRWLAKKTRERRLTPPDLEIRRDGQPYLYRWYIIPRNPLFNVYLHKFVDSDIDDALHDHPWWSLSFMLSAFGGWEHYIVDASADGTDIAGDPITLDYMLHCTRPLEHGDVVFRSAKFLHRIELESKRPIVTLFITGPRFRDWGFNCTSGWKSWKQYQKEGGCHD